MSVTITIALSLGLALSTNPAARAKRGTLLEGATVRFGEGSADLDVPNATALDKAAKVLKSRSKKENIVLVGHTDNRGSRALNRKLSRLRAEAVRDALVARGVDANVLSTIGVGDTERISGEDTPEAHEMNRRVEAWLSPLRPVGHVTWIQRDVEAKANETPDWAVADLDMPLLRRFQVRTLEQSAGEVTLRKTSKVYLSENALIVIYDSAKRTKRSRRATADIKLMEGDIFARLAKREGAPIEIETPAARVSLRRASSRLGFNRKKKTAGIAVYDGNANVSASGKSVKVRKNFGTRVEQGKPPEKPKPLPKPPLFSVPSPLVLRSGQGGALRWTLAARTSTVVIEFAEPEDETFERPERVEKIRGESLDLSNLTAGAHYVRAASIDDRDLIGPPTPPLKVIVLPVASSLGAPLAEKNGAIVMPSPGVFTQPAPPSMRMILGPKDKPAPAAGLPLLTPGTYTVPYRVQLADGTPFVEGVFNVVVSPISVIVDKLEPRVTDDTSMTRVRFRVVGAGETPVSGLSFRQARVDEPLEGLEPMRGDDEGRERASMQRCECVAPDAAPSVEDAGDGYYTFSYQRVAGDGFRNDRVRIYERDTKLVQEFDVPIGARSYEAASPTRSGFIAGIRLGTQIVDEATISLRADAEVGVRLHLVGPFKLDVTGQAGFFRTKVRQLRGTEPSVTGIPLRGRGSVVFDLGGGGFYGGAELGVSLHLGEVVGEQIDEVDPIQPIWGFHGGAYLTAGPGDLVVDVLVGPLDVATGNDARADLGPAFTIGYRFKPWSVASGAVDVREAGDVSEGDLDSVGGL